MRARPRYPAIWPTTARRSLKSGDDLLQERKKIKNKKGEMPWKLELKKKKKTKLLAPLLIVVINSSFFIFFFLFFLSSTHCQRSFLFLLPHFAFALPGPPPPPLFFLHLHSTTGFLPFKHASVKENLITGAIFCLQRPGMCLVFRLFSFFHEPVCLFSLSLFQSGKQSLIFTLTFSIFKILIFLPQPLHSILTFFNGNRRRRKTTPQQLPHQRQQPHQRSQSLCLLVIASR